MHVVDSVTVAASIAVMPLRSHPTPTLVAALLWMTALSAGEGIVVEASAEIDHTLAFAADEARLLLPLAGVPTAAVLLRVDPQLAAGVHMVESTGAQALTLRGRDASAVLDALYAALERLGLHFEISGPVLPIAPVALAAAAGTTRPVVLRRGVRQHINFPMDVSAYSAGEATDYLRALRRMRFNFLVCHSYHGHWFQPVGKAEPPGHFFYGIRYELPAVAPWRGVVRNQRLFCIPEIEAIFDDRPARGRAAQAWLAAFTAEARRIGMTVRVSWEAGGSTEAILATSRHLLTTYPAIHELELITPETFVDPDELPTPAAAAEAFAAAVAGKPSVGTPLPNTLRALAGSLAAARQGSEELAKRGIGLSVGLYCPAVRLQRLAMPLLRAHAPPGVTWNILPAHGARAAADNMRALPMHADDARRGAVYSWIEFDGSMYLQQHSVQGTTDLLTQARAIAGDVPVAAMAFCHWRTAENQAVMRYIARALIDGPFDPAAFHREQATALGIADAAAYAAAMQALDDAETQVRDRLFNVGFCWLGTWGRKGLGKAAEWPVAELDAALAAYGAVRDRLVACLGGAAVERPFATPADANRRVQRPGEAGRAHLDLLINRLDCSLLHLRAVRALVAVAATVGTRTPAQLDDAARAEVRRGCDEALALMDAYLAKHAERIPDRGAEGQLVSYAAIPPVVARRLRAEYGAEKVKP